MKQKKELNELKKVERSTHHLEQHTDCGHCSSGTGSEIITLTQFSKMRDSGGKMTSEPFCTHHHGYKLTLCVKKGSFTDISRAYTYSLIGILYLCRMRGEYDSQLCWPVKIKVHIQLLNQAGDHHHREETNVHTITTEQKEYPLLSVDPPHLINARDGIKYAMNDCLKFRIHITVL